MSTTANDSDSILAQVERVVEEAQASELEYVKSDLEYARAKIANLERSLKLCQRKKRILKEQLQEMKQQRDVAEKELTKRAKAQGSPKKNTQANMKKLQHDLAIAQQCNQQYQKQYLQQKTRIAQLHRENLALRNENVKLNMQLGNYLSYP